MWGKRGSKQRREADPQEKHFVLSYHEQRNQRRPMNFRTGEQQTRIRLQDVRHIGMKAEKLQMVTDLGGGGSIFRDTKVQDEIGMPKQLFVAWTIRGICKRKQYPLKFHNETRRVQEPSRIGNIDAQGFVTGMMDPVGNSSDERMIGPAIVEGKAGEKEKRAERLIRTFDSD